MWGLDPARESQMTCAPWLSHLCLCPPRSHCPPNFKIPLELHNCKYCEYCRYCEYSKYSCTVLRKKMYFSSAPYLDFLAPVLIAQIFCSLSQQFAVFRFSNLTVSVENLCYNLDWKAQKGSKQLFCHHDQFILQGLISCCSECVAKLPKCVLACCLFLQRFWLIDCCLHTRVSHGNIIFKHLAISI